MMESLKADLGMRVSSLSFFCSLFQALAAAALKDDAPYLFLCGGLSGECGEQTGCCTQVKWFEVGLTGRGETDQEWFCR